MMYKLNKSLFKFGLIISQFSSFESYIKPIIDNNIILEKEIYLTKSIIGKEKTDKILQDFKNRSVYESISFDDIIDELQKARGCI